MNLTEKNRIIERKEAKLLLKHLRRHDENFVCPYCKKKIEECVDEEYERSQTEFKRMVKNLPKTKILSKDEKRMLIKIVYG